MSVVITIDGVDKTKNIEYGSLRIKLLLNQKRDTCEFKLITHAGQSYVPAMGREVIVTNGGSRIFGGVITNIDSNPTSYALIEHTIMCQDFSRLLDKKLIPDTFENQTAEAIIDSLNTTYFPSGFTTTNVDAPIIVDFVAFNYLTGTQALDELASLLNYDWYVDPNKDIHFFAKNSETAPFDLNDDDGSYQYESLLIRKDNTQLRNSIVVRGGEFLGSTQTFPIEANGTDIVYPLPYRFSDFAVSLTGQPLSVGNDNLDDPNDYDVLYNFQEKIIRWKDADKPSANAEIRPSGKPYLPVIVKVKNQSLIDATTSAEGGSGVYEHVIIDKSIDSKEGARQRAEGELLAYGQTLSEGEFVTETDGLRAGMSILVNSTSRGVSERFVINKVTAIMFGSDTLRYQVSLITTRTYDLVDILQKLLLQKNKDLVIDPNEVVDLVEAFTNEEITITDSVVSATEHNPISETMTFDETFTAQSLNFETQFVLGSFAPPTGTKRVFILNGSRLGPTT